MEQFWCRIMIQRNKNLRISIVSFPGYKSCRPVLLDRLVDEIRKRRPHLKKKKILFHDDNAPPHTSNIAQAKNYELDFESLPHPPYSLDLAPSDYYLFPNLKRWLCGRCFESNEEVEWETEGYFVGFDKSYYLEGIEKLKDRWTRCIELNGEYIEK